MKLSALAAGQKVKNLAVNQIVAIVAVEKFGDDAAEVTYKDEGGIFRNCILDSVRAATIDLVEEVSCRNFDSNAETFRLASEAYRINAAHLFEPYFAIRASLIEPLPHQISAVYEKMLIRQPLRFVLADDPGAGKTIMTGLLLKELMIRGTVQRCLIVCPGTLVDQWQDELYRKFLVTFEILTRDRIDNAASGNVFGEASRCIVGIDLLARNKDFRKKLQAADWDLIVCDEAHKMSATIQGNKVHKTKRFELGELLRKITRHFLLLTATPHNGKDADFYLFMSLVDPDRFEGARRIKNPVDVSDIMRRLVKEDLLTFEGKPLFPERRAYTLNYALSQEETELYNRVTDYVADGFNRAERLDGRKKNSVGFAMTILQRRLASSPKAIYKSLERRTARLQKDLREKKFSQVANLDDETLIDGEEFPSGELERLENELSERATTAKTTNELRREIQTLRQLTDTAKKVFFGGEDRKWHELSELLQTNEIFSKRGGNREKLIIFTEHRDTLEYLQEKISSLFGRAQAVVSIHGGMNYRERHKTEEQFRQDENVSVLVATDAAGEGINLQNAHLMINYDLPWNPNRLEQRFGRIHRIGQKEVCHLWNLVAVGTREGKVFRRLLEKLAEERTALGGKVFDILGKISFDDRPLRELLIEAIRYGNDPTVIRRLNSVVDESFAPDKLKNLLRERALTEEAFGLDKVAELNHAAELNDTYRLQPFVAENFFVAAFKNFGGQIFRRGNGRYEINHVPASLRDKTLQKRFGESVATQYKRICFDKKNCNIPGRDCAELVVSGHPLLEAVTALTLKRFGDVLRRGTIFVDDTDDGKNLRLLVCVEIALRDGTQQTVFKQLHFLEVSQDGKVVESKTAPYLDYRSPDEPEREKILSDEDIAQLARNLESLAKRYATKNFVLPCRQKVAADKNAYLDKVERAVRERLTNEIIFWDGRAIELQAKDKLNSELATRRADELAERLTQRLEEIDRERQVFASPPEIVSRALIVPCGRLPAPLEENFSPDVDSRERIEKIAMKIVMDIERELGCETTDVSGRKCGFDVRSVSRDKRVVRLLEVKGRHANATTLTVTKNEILTALNLSETFILAIVLVGNNTARVVYVKSPFASPPDFNAVSVNYRISALLQGNVVLDRNISFGGG